MRGDRNAGAVRNLNCEFHLFQREGCVRRAARAPAVIGVKFYPVRAFANLFAHDTRQAVDAVRLFRALRHIPFRSVAFRSITSARDDRARRYKQPRSRNYSLIHRLLQSDVSVTRALGAEIAERREAGEQSAAQVIRSPRNSEA